MATPKEIKKTVALARLRSALEEILALAGRSGPEEVEALNKIEARAKAFLAETQ